MSSHSNISRSNSLSSLRKISNSKSSPIKEMNAFSERSRQHSSSLYKEKDHHSYTGSKSLGSRKYFSMLRNPVRLGLFIACFLLVLRGAFTLMDFSTPNHATKTPSRVVKVKTTKGFLNSRNAMDESDRESLFASAMKQRMDSMERVTRKLGVKTNEEKVENEENSNSKLNKENGFNSDLSSVITDNEGEYQSNEKKNKDGNGDESDKEENLVEVKDVEVESKKETVSGVIRVDEGKENVEEEEENMEEVIKEENKEEDREEDKGGKDEGKKEDEKLTVVLSHPNTMREIKGGDEKIEKENENENEKENDNETEKEKESEKDNENEKEVGSKEEEEKQKETGTEIKKESETEKEKEKETETEKETEKEIKEKIETSIQTQENMITIAGQNQNQSQNQSQSQNNDLSASKGEVGKDGVGETVARKDGISDAEKTNDNHSPAPPPPPPPPPFEPNRNFTLGPKIEDWDEQRAAYILSHPGCNVSTNGRPKTMLVTATDPHACMNPLGDYLTIKFIKNKIDYARMHDIQLYFMQGLVNRDFDIYWSKLPLLRMLMLSHPDVEWFWWMDSDAMFTDMKFEIPFERYDKSNMVIHGWKYLVLEQKDWFGLNAGIYLIRNNKLSLDLLDEFASYGVRGPTRNYWGPIFTKYMKNRPLFEGDDQATILWVLNTHFEKWGAKIYIEEKYNLHGFWVNIVDRYEQMVEDFKGGKRKDNWPFITHFVGCKICGKKPSYDSEKCIKSIQRAFTFADNQVLNRYGYVHPSLTSTKVQPLSNE